MKNLVFNTARINREEIRAMVREAVVEVLHDLVKDEAFRAVVMRSIMREMFGRGGYAPMNSHEIRETIAKQVMQRFDIDVKLKPTP